MVEHTVDLVVARRMKRRGMYWSVDGATHLLMLRALLHHRPKPTPMVCRSNPSGRQIRLFFVRIRSCRRAGR